VYKWEKTSWSITGSKTYIDSVLQECEYKEGSGIGIFVDSIAAKSIASKSGQDFIDSLVNRFSNSPGLISNFCAYPIACFSGNVSLCFSIYIGYDKNGKICRLLADTGRIMLHKDRY